MGLALGPRRRPRTEESVEELGLLARSAGARVVGCAIQERPRPDAATLIGRGKVAQVAALARDAGADLLVFDDELGPAQQRNLEEAIGLKTVDRTQLILDIFARRARTREGRLQVELAQLDYLLPRLAGRGVLLSRLGGGIGTRGPGETKLETDRRRIRQRIQQVRREIEHVRRERLTRREARRRRNSPVVALVGYTNAGKSTLFNALSHAGAVVSDQLFMTLDPLVRRVRLGGGREVMLVDTVGFIQKLPHALVAAFRATLEEVVEADLLLHVGDASAPDLAEREAAVVAVLRGDRSRGAAAASPCSTRPTSRRPSEGWPSPRRGRGRSSSPPARGRGWAISWSPWPRALTLELRQVRLRFRTGERRAIASVYASGRVLRHDVDGEDVVLHAELAERDLDRYRERLR